MATFTNQTKNTSAFSTQSKNSATWTTIGQTIINVYLLLETGGYVLQETGFKLMLDQSIPTRYPFTNQVKN